MSIPAEWSICPLSFLSGLYSVFQNLCANHFCSLWTAIFSNHHSRLVDTWMWNPNHIIWEWGRTLWRKHQPHFQIPSSESLAEEWLFSLGLHTLRAGELITHTAKSALLETSGVLYVLTFGDLWPNLTFQSGCFLGYWQHNWHIIQRT